MLFYSSRSRHLPSKPRQKKIGFTPIGGISQIIQLLHVLMCAWGVMSCVSGDWLFSVLASSSLPLGELSQPRTVQEDHLIFSLTPHGTQPTPRFKTPAVLIFFAALLVLQTQLTSTKGKVWYASHGSISWIA